VPWQVPGFEVETSKERLRDIDAHIRRTGSFDVRNHRFLVRAHKSSPSTSAVEPVIRMNGVGLGWFPDAQLSGFKKLFMGNAVQRSMDAEVAGLDRAKSVLEART
jgi:hypothetical protein